MVYTVSSFFVTIAFHISEWLLCPEAILVFVISLSLFNILRLLKAIFVFFCRWKYKADSNLCVRSQNSIKNETETSKKYCHDEKSYDMATFSLQGRRKTMEDRFCSIPHNFDENHSVYAVFDGHGGEFAAEYVEEYLFRSINGEISRGSFCADTNSVQQVLTSLMRTVDAQLICISRDRMDLSGSTCVLAFQLGDVLTVANVGDSRAVMCTGDGRAVAMSKDHKPTDPKEQKRITEAGGFVTFNGVWRVAGVLATSRAFGDYPLKQRKFVTCEPEFYTVDLSKIDPHFIILATDGLWDVFSNEEAVNFIRCRLDEPHFGAKSLALQAYYRGSLDNITVMVIHLKRKRTSQKKHEKALKDRQAAEFTIGRNDITSEILRERKIGHGSTESEEKNKGENMGVDENSVQNNTASNPRGDPSSNSQGCGRSGRTGNNAK